MKESVFITGIAGSGKSSVAKELTSLGYEAYDIEDIPGMFRMIHKTSGAVNDSYDNGSLDDVENHDWVCDVLKLKQLIKNQKSDKAYYCGISSNQEELLPLFTKTVVLSASPEVVNDRLSTRKEGEYGATKEVRDLELQEKDWFENSMKEKGAVIVDANASVRQVVDLIVKF